MRSEANVIVVAASREQANILRVQAEQMVRRSGVPVGKFGWRIGDTIFEVKAGYREIRLGDAKMRVLAADAATADGEIPTLALVDELHRHRSLDLYGVLADGLEAPAPAGAGGSLKDFEAFCSQLILDNGEPMVLEPHEKRMARLYFDGYREIVVVIGKKNGKTTFLAALALYHLKVGAPMRQMITISTAGDSEEGNPLGHIRRRAHRMESFRRRGCLNTALAADRSFAWLEWCLEPDDDVTDWRLVKKANPASWHTPESLERRYHSPSMTPGRWARFACGIWTSGEEPWITAREWKRMAVDIGGVVDGESVRAAVVFGENPAIAVAAPRPDDVAVLEVEDDVGGEPMSVEVVGAAVKVWIREGKVSHARVEADLRRLAERYDLLEVAYDRVEFQRSAELLEADGLPMREVPHSPERLSIMSQTLDRIVRAGVLRHDGDETLARQVTQVVTKETERGWRLLKSSSSRGVIAMAVAVHQATQLPSEPEAEDLIAVVVDV